MVLFRIHPNELFIRTHLNHRFVCLFVLEICIRKVASWHIKDNFMSPDLFNHLLSFKLILSLARFGWVVGPPWV